MKLYYAHFSPQARAVLMTIRNLNLEVEIINVNFQKGENKTEEFTKLNPLQQVPILVEDDGFTLTESEAIMAYLVTSRNPNSSLYPINDAMKKALVDERLFYNATSVFFSHIQILHPMLASGEASVSNAKIEILRNVLLSLNNFLEGKKWFTGDDEATIADLSILSNLIVMMCAGIRIDKYRNLSEWFERCKKLEGFEENYEGGKIVSGLLKMKNLPPLSQI
ncbi:hypothetical protein PVAND_004744 [Polypedilum vanderplanki]|uniref:glutathione transferase n=1 Tax=Polypedilum vanderplanki TaxID=319348 RepID=A0A9J6BY35_POLVA|nr:hypothetical protein PVAND_004744 [Polypedilum vanderplanki]